MYRVSELCKQALNTYKRDLRFKVIMDNDVIQENDIIEFSIKEGIVPNENFELGGAIATSLDLKINNLHKLYTNVNFKGKVLKLEIGILLKNGDIEYVPMGIFNVDDYKENGNFIDIETLDNMIKFETEYKSKLAYPTSANKVLNEICSICGVFLETTSFLNDTYTMDKPIEGETCRAILHDIAILAGGFAKINRKGNLELITPTNADIEINKDNYIKLEVKEAFYINKYVVDETYFPVDSIPLNLNVVPFKATWQGNLSMDVGDKIQLNDDKKVIQTIVTKQTIKFNGGLTYESECTGLSEQQQNTQLVNQKKINRRFSSEIKQNADEILLRVTADGVESLVKQNADKWELSINGKLTGMTYTFDGEAFTLGGRTGDIAKHTNSYSEWRFDDGSVARVDREGFYNRIGSNKREYHHLNYAGTTGFTSNSNYGSQTVKINLPEEFKGKNFMASVSLSRLVPNRNYIAIAQIDCIYKNMDIGNGSFEIGMYYTVHDIGGTGWDNNVDKVHMEVMYNVTA